MTVIAINFFHLNISLYQEDVLACRVHQWNYFLVVGSFHVARNDLFVNRMADGLVLVFASLSLVVKGGIDNCC